MGMIQTIFDWLKPDNMKGVGSTVMSFGVHPQYPPDDYRDLAAGAYGKNELVYAAIQKIASSIAEAPLRVYRKRDEAELPDHRLRQLIAQPNLHLTEYAFWETLIMHLYLAGNVFIEKVRSSAGKIVELWFLRPDRVQIVPSKETFIGGYLYVLEGQNYPVDVKDMIHIKFANPLNDYFGMAPLKAGLRQVATDNESTDFAKVILENRGQPGIAVRLKKPINDDEELKRAKEKWRNSFSGDKRGGVAFISGTESIETVSMNMQELAFADLRGITETRILTIFGVPPILLGVKSGLDRSTFANYAEARKAFHEETISPLENRLDDIFDVALAMEFGNDIVVRFDTSRVSALAGVRQQRFDNAQQGVTSGWMSVNEGRHEVGLDPVIGGDVFLRGLAIQSIPTGTKSGRKEIKADDHPTALLDHALGRQNNAELYLEQMTVWAVKEFKAQGRDVLKVFDKIVGKAAKLTQQEFIELGFELSRFEQEWSVAMLETASPLLLLIINDAAEAAAEEIGVVFDLTSDVQQAYIEQYTFKFAEKISSTSVADVRDVIMRSQRDGLSYREMREALKSKFSDWTKARAQMVARTEVNRAANHGAEEAWRQSGITEKEWLVAGDACPYCQPLNGQRTTIGGNFLELGDSHQPEGVDRPLAINYEEIQTPPLHPNCRCTLIPVI